MVGASKTIIHKKFAKILRWCHKEYRRLDFWARITERQFTKIGSYWWCGNDDPHTVQPNWVIQDYSWNHCRIIRWQYLFVNC